MQRRERRPRPPEVDPDEVDAQASSELPPREAMSLIDPGLVAGAGTTAPLPDADQATTFAGQSTADASHLSGQATQSAAAAAASQAAPGAYSPSVTSVASS